MAFSQGWSGLFAALIATANKRFLRPTGKYELQRKALIDTIYYVHQLQYQEQ